MAVFEFSATPTTGDGHPEMGTVVARDKLDAFDKLRRNQFGEIHLRRLGGWSAFVARFRADIK